MSAIRDAAAFLSVTRTGPDRWRVTVAAKGQGLTVPLTRTGLLELLGVLAAEVEADQPSTGTGWSDVSGPPARLSSRNRRDPWTAPPATPTWRTAAHALK